MKSWLVSLSIALVCMNVVAPTACVSASLYAESSEKKAIRKTFADYKRALLAQRGQSAVRLVNAATIRYYETERQMALRGEEGRVRSLAPTDRFLILLFRQLIPAAKLQAMSGRELFRYSVDKGWAGEAVGQNSLGRIRITGSRATAQQVIRGQEMPLQFVFTRKSGQWKMDIPALLSLSDEVLRAQIRASNQNADDYLLSILEAGSGKKASPSLWKPLLGSSTSGGATP